MFAGASSNCMDMKTTIRYNRKAYEAEIRYHKFLSLVFTVLNFVFWTLGIALMLF